MKVIMTLQSFHRYSLLIKFQALKADIKWILVLLLQEILLKHQTSMLYLKNYNIRILGPKFGSLSWIEHQTDWIS